MIQDDPGFDPSDWEEVTDPREIKKVVGQGGLTKIVGGDNGGGGGKGADPAKTQQRNANLDSLIEQINRVQGLYNENYKGRPLSRLGGLTEYLPGPTHSQFNSASAGLSEQGLAAFRVPGVGAQSDTELRQFVEANRPYANDYDETVEEKLRQLRNRVDATRRAQGLPPVQWGGLAAGTDQQPIATTQQPQQPPASPPPGSGPTPPSPGGPAPDEMLRFNDEARPTIGYRLSPEQQGQIADAVRAGDEGQAIALLQRFSGNPATAETIKSVRANIEAAQRNPAHQIDFGYGSVDDAARSAAEREKFGDYLPQALEARKTAGVDATVRGVAQGIPLFGGWFDEAQAMLDSVANGTDYNDEWRKQQAIDEADSRIHPKKQFGGQVAGTIVPGIGIAKVLSSGSALAKTGKAIGADIAIGASYGAGSDRDGKRLEGAGQGAILAPLAGQIGRSTVSALGKTLSPVADASVRRLMDDGVTLTPGQVAGARGGVLGRFVKGMEDRATSVPLVGDAINGARRRGLEQWNVSAVNRTLQPIGVKVPKDVAAGHDAIEFAETAISNQIENSLSGINAQADAAFNVGAVKVARMADRLPQVQKEAFKTILDTELQPFLSAQSMNGAQLQAVKQTLDGHITNFATRGSPSDRLLVPVLEEARDQFLALASRSSPQAMKEFKKANEAFARLVRVQAAAKQNVKDGLFTPNQLATAVRQSDRSSRKRMTAKGKALMQDFAADGQNVLPSGIPDSGTAGRLAGLGAMAAPGALGALVNPTMLAAMAPALAYMPGVSTAVQNALLRRPDGVIKAGQALQRNALVGGALAAPFGMATIKE